MFLFQIEFFIKNFLKIPLYYNIIKEKKIGEIPCTGLEPVTLRLKAVCSTG